MLMSSPRETAPCMATDVPACQRMPVIGSAPACRAQLMLPLGSPDKRAPTRMMTNTCMNPRLMAVALTLAAAVGCGGGEKAKPESTAAVPPSAAPGAAPAAPAPAAPGAAQAITGKTWD